MLPISAAVVAFVNAATQLVVAFGLELTTDQTVAISTLVNAGVLLIVAVSHAYRAQRTELERQRELEERAGRWSHLNGEETHP